MANFLDELLGLGEAGLTIGTGAVSGMVGMPYGLYKGMTGGGYGTPAGVQQAQQEAEAFMQRNTYQPRTEAGQGIVEFLGDAMTASKLPPVMPEAMALSSIPVGASAARMAENAAAPRQLGSQAGAIRFPGAGKFDPRFDPRVKEQPSLVSLKTDVTESGINVPRVSLADFEGRPFITTMSDRTNVGLLNQINDVNLNRPVNMQGGQGFMFENPGMVWASAKGPSKQILNEAEIIKQVTGQNPLYIPWRMAPTGGDFASMTGESMLSYADTAMSKSNKKKLDKMIKTYIPDWAGVSSEKAPEQFRSAPDKVRKALKNEMDVNFRDAGGLGIGQARLSVSDPAQLASRDAGIMNVGEVFANQPLIPNSGHVAYPTGVPGQGLGQLKEDLSIFQLMPNVVQARGIPDALNPRATDIRALQMKPYAGVITEGLLKSLGY
tara:strand:- start:7810 stop:9117 length:1308 start_codon:yes stop_codon:yes gene_type:complete